MGCDSTEVYMFHGKVSGGAAERIMFVEKGWFNFDQWLAFGMYRLEGGLYVNGSHFCFGIGQITDDLLFYFQKLDPGIFRKKIKLSFIFLLLIDDNIINKIDIYF